MAVYNIALVSANLRPEEMIIQMADTLDFLNEVTNDICSRINRKINEEIRTRIQDINKRIETAQAKIDRNAGSRKAIQLFSSSQFPVTYHEEEASSAFNTRICSCSLSFKRTELGEIESETLDINNSAFFQSLTTNVAEKPLLTSITSVSELLIFNTENLVFQEQNLLNKLSKTSSRKNHDSGRSGNTPLGDAPWSIGQQESQVGTTALNFSYVPGNLRHISLNKD